MLIYSHYITPRLQYVADLLSKEWDREVNLTDNKERFILFTEAKLNYSDQKIDEEEVWVKPVGLLFEKGIRSLDPEIEKQGEAMLVFPVECDMAFDSLSAIFFLVSRYEEYLPHAKDEYGRYAHVNSFAYRHGFLDRPLVNEWMEQLRNKLGINSTRQFRFIPTYDIDEAWSYKNKNWWRSTGGAARDLLKGEINKYSARRKAIAGKITDPYDSFDWLDELHVRHSSLEPRYFFHVAEKNGRYDKNNLPSEPAMQQLIRRHAERYKIGLHPSWQSGDEENLLLKEKQKLEQISGQTIIRSRQHFIRMEFPLTYRKLIAAGINEDYSMGYGSINGFRASIASPFYWYDLEKERPTSLSVHPFCFMEANSFFEQKQDPEEALKEMRSYKDAVSKVNGTMLSIWHNTFLGTEPRFKGWREVYAKFIGTI